ncbi:hypothetical protein [Jiangella sp. DSM 45060]|uniref:hypothetical protein n=1 Tax=Jiangella sp. DSM 45060 TaxID=1798224 RepID=UPI00087DB06A|nr:hypothetical protein [Jiangella sp. DSM 45060]SDT35574.1 hypothetical protein SAMN04515669_3689 [Jiangella sp. DSM 45060]
MTDVTTMTEGELNAGDSPRDSDHGTPLDVRDLADDASKRKFRQEIGRLTERVGRLKAALRECMTHRDEHKKQRDEMLEACDLMRASYRALESRLEEALVENYQLRAERQSREEAAPASSGDTAAQD